MFEHLSNEGKLLHTQKGVYICIYVSSHSAAEAVEGVITSVLKCNNALLLQKFDSYVWTAL